MGTRLDPNQISRIEHDESSEAKRVKIVGTQLQIALDESEDSIAVRPVLYQGVFDLDEAVDVRKVRDLRLFIKKLGGTSATVSIQASPDDSGDDFAQIDTVAVDGDEGSVVATQVIHPIARRLKCVILSGDVHVEIKLVGQG